MGKLNKSIGPVLGLVLVLSLLIMPSAVQADEVEVVITEDTHIEYVCCDICENLDDEGLMLCNGYDPGTFDWRDRCLLKLPDQSGGGNISQVLFKMWYYDWFEADPEGLDVRVYRCTRDFVDDEACWYKYDSGHDWTTPGGDYTVTNYAQTEMPEEDNWVTWNITDMANDAWITDGEDLYILVRFRYENEDNPDDVSFAAFTPGWGTASHRPRMFVTFAEAVQTPEVAHELYQYGSSTTELTITPTLYDWPWGVLYGQASVHGADNWTYTSSGLNVTDNEPVNRTITGLTKSTLYDVRAKLVYASGTVYSANTTVTTLDYDVPNWYAGYTDVETNAVHWFVKWTGNNDTESVSARLGYRRKGLAEWTYTDWDTYSDVTKTIGHIIEDLYDDRTYEYFGQFTISPYVWETAVYEVDTLEGVFLDASISDVDVDFFQIKVDYEANNVSDFDLQARQRLNGGVLWDYSDEVEGLSGNGTQYFLFEDLRSMREYEWEVTATWDEGSSTTSGLIYTSGIEDPPELSNLDATFISPYTMRVSADVVLNDADYLDPPMYCRYKPLTGSTWYTSNDEVEVTDDGNWYVDLVCGDELDWETGYDFYAEIDYTAGTNQTDQDIFYTPEEPLAVVTVGVTGISGTSAYMRGYAQLQDWDGLYGYFEYWVAGSLEETYTRSDYLWLTDSGAFQIQVDDMVFGEDYQYQAAIIETTGIGPPLAYGGILSFTCGYWGGGEPVTPPDVYDVYGEIWDWFANSTPGHWTILLVGMAVLALIFHKQRAIAVICCFVVLGIGIVINWVDTWVIVLLAIGGGLTVWRWIGSRRGATL